MRRHEFKPGRLIAGLFLMLTGVVYAGDAGGLWETPWFAVIPLVTGGLFLAAVTGSVAHGIRRRHRRGVPAPDPTHAPG
ncbi:hypothetical protein ACH4Y0_17300 [Streptomyces sp. NPDC020707]|uniref:Integral membrane protein n=1 Tax=Streptomyces ortus TaxID=2867268 RepID=A0ABT3V2Y7_9ACTN|nr:MULTISPECIES: hypothetical protein [Streptomyces]MCX4233972.1 hypothetical protein [Streptomyces ortus]